ncbi:glycoside hydrolase family 2 TIM barrel-domain containing protein [Cryptosporangium minutisporangium]|uniref:Glycoside hydrolase family 2 TIM barrel-domain containing protein n=1 Tax=Cryptosporangium minutisporangium TaxID=113569 RepID=A0ABP6SR74_9ACTN
MTRQSFNEGWSYRPKVSAFQEVAGAGTETWTPVVLPHDALLSGTRRPDVPGGETTGFFPGGVFEYRTQFPVAAAERGNRIELEFDGVYRDAMVYVNGSLAGQRAFGYSRFAIRIDPYLRFGEDNEVRVHCRAHLDSRWYSGAGIYRDVTLVSKGPAHLANGSVRITTPDVDADRAVVEISVQVRNSTQETRTLTVSAAVADAEGSDLGRDRSPVTLLPGRTETVRHRVYVAQPSLWSVESPNLHTARIGLYDGDQLLDEESVRFGIRTLQLDPHRGLRINGREVTLRGACIHHDNGPLGAATIGRAEERRVEILKAAGFNAIRSAHHPMSSALLDACDRLGMLVMDEAFDMWTSSKSDFDYSFDFPEWWERDVEAMVAKDFNHPSVLFYSIGNEIPEAGSGTGAAWGRRLAEKVRSLDSTRFVTNGINGFVAVLDVVLPAMRRQRQSAEGGVNTMMAQMGAMLNHISSSELVTERTAESFAVLDVAGMNYADGRYELDRELFPNRVIVGTETFPSRIAEGWALVRANSHVLGEFTWTGWDYLGEAGVGVIRYADEVEPGSVSIAHRFPALTAWTGDIDITGRRRPISYYREIVFGLRSDPYLAVHRPENRHREVAIATPWSWSDAVASWSWDGCDGTAMGVEVYSDAEEIELLLNGDVVGRERVGAKKAYQADFEVPYRAGELTAVAYTAGQESGRHTLASASGTLVLRAEADRADIRATTDDLAFVSITLTDEEGTVYPARDRDVTVQVAGPAVLQGLASADPMNTESFLGDRHRTFDGRALAVVRPTGTGDITVRVEAPDCASVTVTLHAR